MKPAPSKLVEAVVGFLIPPACREYVLGDLHERYTAPSQYILEAARTVPLVIMSRIRRTTDAPVLLMEAFALYMSFLAAPWFFHQMSFLYEEDGLLRLAIPTAVALVALILGDAYANRAKRSRLQPIQDSAFCLGAAFLSEAALSAADPDLIVPRWIMISGACMSLLLVSTLRMLFPPDDKRPRGATVRDVFHVMQECAVCRQGFLER